MKQLKIIKELPALFANIHGVNAALIIGSFAREQSIYKSDIDVTLWIIENEFNPEDLATQIKNILPGVIYTVIVNQKNRMAVYFSDCPRLEIVWHAKLDGIDRNYLGSEIIDIAKSILFVRRDLNINLVTYLQEITARKKERLSAGLDVTHVHDLTEKFICNFESASYAHNRSDSYKSYFFYNVALQTAVELNHIAMGYKEHNYLPKNFAHCYIESPDLMFFRDLAATLYLPNANQKKRNLLVFFYKALENLPCFPSDKIEEIINFLEFVYNRDFMWNFRDAASINMKLKPGKIFRASSATRYQDESFFENFIKANEINTVIDLRDDDEYDINAYTEKSLSLFKHIRLGIDPRQQDEDFRRNYHYGTHTQIAYRHFAIGHKHVFRQLFEKVDPASDVILIHCHAGKDRTGAMIAMLALLMGESIENVKYDFFTSEMDTRYENLKAFLDVVYEHGSIEDFLMECGISPERIEYWKKHLTRNHEILQLGIISVEA